MWRNLPTWSWFNYRFGKMYKCQSHGSQVWRCFKCQDDVCWRGFLHKHTVLELPACQRWHFYKPNHAVHPEFDSQTEARPRVYKPICQSDKKFYSPCWFDTRQLAHCNHAETPPLSPEVVSQSPTHEGITETHGQRSIFIADHYTSEVKGKWKCRSESNKIRKHSVEPNWTTFS